MLHTHIILNPVAGRGAAARAGDVVPRAFRSHGWTTELLVTERPGHATELARAAAEAGAKRVIAVGGDGVVHEVANGLLQAGSDAQLGVIPIGSGNDFAKVLGVFRLSPERAVARVVTAQPRRFDVGKVNDEWFVNTMGFGFGPAVVQLRNRSAHLTGFLSYLIPILRAFGSFVPPHFEIRAPGFQASEPMMMVEVCNGTTAGGSYRFAPEADPTDGKLDVCVVRRVRLPRFLMAIPRVIRGTHGTMPEVTIFRTARLVLKTPHVPLILHLDGELREPRGHECTVTLERHKLNVLVAG